MRQPALPDQPRTDSARLVVVEPSACPADELPCMAPGNRYLLPGQIYHLTHRCHDRKFLLRFGRDRDAYLFWLREALRRYGVTLLGYGVTCNHVHLVVHGTTAEAVSERSWQDPLSKSTAGDFTNYQGARQVRHTQRVGQFPWVTPAVPSPARKHILISVTARGSSYRDR